MDLKTGSIFAVTTIHDRSGRRVGSYLVDRAKDSLDREQKNKNPQQNSTQQEQAVVFHHSEEAAKNSKSDHGEIPGSKDTTALNLTV